MTYCSVVAVLALVGLTKKRFSHYAILKLLSLRSQSIGLMTLCLLSYESQNLNPTYCLCSIPGCVQYTEGFQYTWEVSLSTL